MTLKSTLMSVVILLLMTPLLLAQEGHPLDGSWIGEWGPNANDRNFVTIVMEWDGRQVNGVVNPGTDSLPIKNVVLNTEGWTVHIEVDAMDRQGDPVTYMIDGQIENLGLPSRVIRGTWVHDGVQGDFLIERQ